MGLYPSDVKELPYSKAVDVLLEVFGGGSVEIEGQKSFN